MKPDEDWKPANDAQANETNENEADNIRNTVETFELQDDVKQDLKQDIGHENSGFND